MNKLPVRAGVGLVVLNTPLPQVSNRFKSLFPQILSYVDNLLYVHILPEATLLSHKSKDDGTNCSENKIVANWTKVATNIYSHGSLKPNLDLRLVLTGVKNPLISSFSQLKTNHSIEVVLFDPSIESNWVQEYKNGCLREMLGTSINGPKHITLDLPVETEKVETSSYPSKTKSTDKVYSNVVLGGTFDRIHAGHKILLTTSLLRCKDEITIGITNGEDMMRKKVLPELMLSCEQRIHEVKEFIRDVDSSLQQYKVVPITDPFGPSVVDPNLQLIIGSQETEKGCKKVNQVRKEKNLSQLDIHVIDLVDDGKADKSSPENEGKVSSSSQRMRLLGNELNKPLKKWDKENSPYLIGLTGGSCGGKTNIANYLETLGAGVINCDLLGHEAYHPGTLGFTKVIDAFGKEMIGSDGLIDRRKLGAKVFGIENEKNKQKLESIVWPEIWKIVQKQIAFMWKEQGKNVVIIDAAVLLQAGWKDQVNQVWVSIVDPETAVKRIMERDRKSEDEAQKRLSSQLSNQKYVDNANVVFCSKWEVSYTRKQVDRAWKSYELTSFHKEMTQEGDKIYKDVLLNECDKKIDTVEYLSNKVMLYGEHPFDIVHAGDTTVLEKIVDRTLCELCGKSRMYYCYTCFIPLPSTRELIPNIDKLPCKIDIIKHPREVDGKSTAGHAKLICPNDVRIFTCPDIPEYSNSSEMVYLMYPGKDAEILEDFLSNFLSGSENSQIKDAECLKNNVRIVFIDSTWNQTARILKHQNIKALKKVKIDDRDTVFWRYQTGKSTKHLATIEAIYYFLVDFHTKVLNQPYNREYDQLLFLYKFMYGKIHELYDRSKLRSYNR